MGKRFLPGGPKLFTPQGQLGPTMPRAVQQVTTRGRDGRMYGNPLLATMANQRWAAAQGGVNSKRKPRVI